MAAGAAELQELGREIVKASYLKGEFILRSGKKSDRYFDKFLFETDPALLRRLGRHLAELVPADTQLLAAPELGAVLLGGAVSMQMGLPVVLVRKEPKGYGTAKQIEGRYKKRSAMMVPIGITRFEVGASMAKNSTMKKKAGLLGR